MAKSVKKHPLRTLSVVAVIAGAVIAIRNSIADKGGSYTPPFATDEPADSRAADNSPADVSDVERPPAAKRPAVANDIIDDADDEDPSIAAALDKEFGRVGPRPGDRLHDEGSADEIALTKIDPFGIR